MVLGVQERRSTTAGGAHIQSLAAPAPARGDYTNSRSLSKGHALKSDSLANPSLTRRQSLMLFGSAAAAGAILIAEPFGTTAARAATPDVTLLDAASTTWRYLDNNVDPAAGAADVLAWTTADYDAGSWKTGKGSFGAKNGAKSGMGGGLAVTTLLNQYIGGASSDNVPTFFFRTSFELSAEQLADIGTVRGSARYDDAMVVYVNGQRAAGFEDAELLPGKNLQYGGGNGADPRTATFTVAQDLLQAGSNTVAVALHQCNAGSSDVYFELLSLTAGQDAGAAAQLSDFVLNIGRHAGEVGLAWYTTSGKPELAQLTTLGGDFASATSFPATGGPATDGQEYRHATLSGLAANTGYSYRVGSEDGGWSETFNFATRAQTGDFSFMVVGDSQIGASGNADSDAAGWATTLSKAESFLADKHFILSVGDQVNTAGNENQYDGFLAPEQLRQQPLVTNIGNHDVGSLAYRQHFNMPNIDESFGAGSAGQSGGNYWFSYNDVLFISFNSNNQENARHLEYVAKIVTQEGAGQKWIVVHFHHSIFSVAAHANDSDIIERRRVLPAGFSEIGVDVVLMGHDHVYTRSYLMNGLAPQGSTDTPEVARSVAQRASGTVVPHPGDVLYLTANSSSGSKYYDIQTGQDFYWSDVENQEYVPNVTNVEVTDDALTLTTYRVTDLSVVDAVRLEKPDTTAPVLTVPASSTLTVGADFDPLAGVTAADNRDGDLTRAITVTGAVEMSTPGNYELQYSVSDAAGNTASATRKVSVIAAAVPSPSPTGPAPTPTATGTPTPSATGTASAPATGTPTPTGSGTASAPATGAAIGTWAGTASTTASGAAVSGGSTLAQTGFAQTGLLATAVAAIATGAAVLGRRGRRSPSAASPEGNTDSIVSGSPEVD